jgi:hypothetical protein
MANPAGAAIVNALGPIRQIVRGEDDVPRRYLVIVPGAGAPGVGPVQVQADTYAPPTAASPTASPAKS